MCIVDDHHVFLELSIIDNSLSADLVHIDNGTFGVVAKCQIISVDRLDLVTDVRLWDEGCRRAIIPFAGFRSTKANDIIACSSCYQSLS